MLLALWCLSFAFGIACAVAGALRVGVAVTLAAAIGAEAEESDGRSISFLSYRRRI